MKNFKKPNFVALLSIFLLILMIILAVNGKRYIQTTFYGIKLWATSVLPALLPFFFLTALFTSTGTAEKLSKRLSPVTRFLYGADGICAYVQIMSFLSGYPIGAKIVSDLYKSGVIDEKQAEKYCTFTSTSSPAFIIGGVGISMFSSAKIGALIFASHIISSVLTGVLFRKLPDNRPIAGLLKSKAPDNALYEAMYGSVISVLLVGGFVAVFYTVSKLLEDFGLFNLFTPILSPVFGEELTLSLLTGIVECTGGCALAASAGSPLSAPIAAAIISLGGVSVWCQSAIYLKAAKVRVRIFILSKILHALSAFVICFFLQGLL